MRRAETRFIGRVQGVGFRATVRDIAHSFPIAGWVRNEPDGSVVVVCEGEQGDVDRFILEIQSRMARTIRSIDRIDGEAAGE